MLYPGSGAQHQTRRAIQFVSKSYQIWHRFIRGCTESKYFLTCAHIWLVHSITLSHFFVEVAVSPFWRSIGIFGPGWKPPCVTFAKKKMWRKAPKRKRAIRKFPSTKENLKFCRTSVRIDLSLVTLTYCYFSSIFFYFSAIYVEKWTVSYHATLRWYGRLLRTLQRRTTTGRGVFWSAGVSAYSSTSKWPRVNHSKWFLSQDSPLDVFMRPPRFQEPILH